MYVNNEGQTVLYRALTSVTKDGKKLFITDYCLDDNNNIIRNPRTKSYIQEQERKQAHIDEFIID